MARFLMTAIVLGAAALASLTAPGLGASGAAEWRYCKPAPLPDGFPGGLVAAAVDLDVYAHARRDLGDLRVFEGEGRETPYKLLVESGDHRRGRVESAMRDLGRVPGSRTSFVLELPQNGALHNEVEIRTSSNNFRRRVEIEGSEDGDSWRLLEGDGLIFDFTIEERGFNSRETRVAYPASSRPFPAGDD